MPIVPPPPTGNSDINSPHWIQWFTYVRRALTGIDTIAWTNLNFSGSNLSDIATRNHNDTTSKQGGTTNEYYHLTSAQHTDLTDGGDSTLHYHSSDKASGYSGTITTAKLTGGGANGSMTFTNGVLKTQTAAT